MDHTLQQEFYKNGIHCCTDRGRGLKTKINFEINAFLNYELQEREIQNQIETITKTFLFSFHVLNIPILEIPRQ